MIQSSTAPIPVNGPYNRVIDDGTVIPAQNFSFWVNPVVEVNTMVTVEATGRLVDVG